MYLLKKCSLQSNVTIILQGLSLKLALTYSVNVGCVLLLLCGCPERNETFQVFVIADRFEFGISSVNE